MFLSGKELKSRLEQFVRLENGNPVPDKQIDCAAITLTIGPEIFITPNKKTDPSIKQSLCGEKTQRVIPPGQFAVLLTEEYVTVPTDYLAFISFKASFKFKGLINVSGFHVDPGWDGRLLFSVYNAGPQDITIEKGDQFALIWYSQLLNGSDEFSRINKGKKQIEKINSSFVMQGEVFSPFKIHNEVDELEQKIRDSASDLKEQIRDSELSAQKEYNKMLRRILLAILVSTLVIFFKENLINFFVEYRTASQTQANENQQKL